jgi:hypothetical protein
VHLSRHSSVGNGNLADRFSIRCLHGDQAFVDREERRCRW